VYEIPDLNLLGQDAIKAMPWMPCCFPKLRLTRLITGCWLFLDLTAWIDTYNRYVVICVPSSASFKPELGCLRGVQLEVEFKPDASPIFCKPRSVPFATQEELAQS